MTRKQTPTQHSTPDLSSDWAETGEVGSVYILQFVHPHDPTRKLGGRANYYIGWARNVQGRIHYHRQGRGAAITRAAVEQGFELQLVALWDGVTRAFERSLKGQKSASRIVSRYQAQYGIPAQV